MALSNLSDIAAACKRKRKERDVLISSYESIVSIDEAKKVPKEVKEVWLVAKFGLERIMAARNLINAVPESLTDAQQKEVLSDSYDAACALMADFHDLLTDIAPPSAPILAPPTRSCYECGRLLVSNHKTRVRSHPHLHCRVSYPVRTRRIFRSIL